MGSVSERGGFGLPLGDLVNPQDLLDQAVTPGRPKLGSHRLFSKSDGVYSEDSNGNVVGPFGKSGPSGFIGASAYNSATQSLGSGAFAAATFDSEYWDTDGFHSTSANTSRMTIPAGMGGKYLCVGHAYFAASSAGTLRAIAFFKNGVEVAPQERHPATTVGTDPMLGLTMVLDLAAGDYVELQALQDTGGALNIGSATTAIQNTFAIVKLDAGRVGSGVGCRAYNSTTQSIPNTTVTALTFDSESFDTDGFHSTSVNTNRITIPAGLGGKYLVIGGGGFSPSSGGARRSVEFQKNGAGMVNGGAAEQASPNASVNPAFSVSTVVDLVAGDYLELYVYQDSGGALNFGGGNNSNTAHLEVMRLDSTTLNQVGTPVRASAPASTLLSTTSGTFVEVSAAMELTVLAGASGNVWVTGCLDITSSSGGIADCVIGVGVDGGGASVAGAHAFNGNTREPVPLGYVVTGLTPGTTHTLKLYWYQVGGTTLSIDGNTRGASYQGSWWQAIPL